MLLQYLKPFLKCHLYADGHLSGQQLLGMDEEWKGRELCLSCVSVWEGWGKPHARTDCNQV